VHVPRARPPTCSRSAVDRDCQDYRLQLCCFEARLLQLVAVRRTRFHGRQTPEGPKRSGSRGSPGKASCQCQASATPIVLAASERAHFIQGGAPHVQGAHHVVARLPHTAAAPQCANQVAAVLRRTPTACSTNLDQHRQAGYQRHFTINVEHLYRTTFAKVTAWPSSNQD